MIVNSELTVSNVDTPNDRVSNKSTQLSPVINVLAQSCLKNKNTSQTQLEEIRDCINATNTQNVTRLHCPLSIQEGSNLTCIQR